VINRNRKIGIAVLLGFVGLCVAWFVLTAAPGPTPDDVETAIEFHTSALLAQQARQQVNEVHAACYASAVKQSKFPVRRDGENGAWMINNKEQMVWRGDDLEQQSVFGPFQPMSYLCAWDLSVHRVISVDVFDRF
jgi:hypothetical protein